MSSWNRVVRAVAGLCLLGLVAAPTVVSADTPAPSAAAVPPVTGEAEGGDAGARRLPTGFNDSAVGRVVQPTGMAWTPDGRMLVISKPGKLVVMEEGRPNQVALDLRRRVCSDFELGLLGIAVDPKFADNRFVYLYYSRERGGGCRRPGAANKPVNQVGRFVLPAGNVIDPASEKVIVDNIVSAEAHHVAGDLEFGADGYLYVTVGDGVCSIRGDKRCGSLNRNSQDRAVPHGKVLRVGRAGRAAPTNPYVGASGARRCTDPAGTPPGTGPCKEIYAMGFRNPFRFARKPGTSTFYVNDVGLQTWEEIDRLVPGRNYGWNKREGFCATGSKTDCGKARGMKNPIFAYAHRNDCRSVTGGAFVPDGLWPGYDGAYLFADYACGKVWRLEKTDAGGYARRPFSSGLSGPTQLRFGPYGDTQALYYLSIFDGEVRRIVSTTANSQPTASFRYTPDGPQVTFSGAASRDGDVGDEIATWSWDFGDGTPVVETTGPTVSHTYASVGTKTVTLTVTDSRGLVSEPFSRTVHAGEHAPSLTFTQPDPDALFGVGDPFAVAVSATDEEDGDLPGSSVTWLIKRQHANHVHPFLGPVSGASVQGVYPEAEDIDAAADSRLVVEATAVDSRGHRTTVTRTLEPRRVALTFLTRPRGGAIAIEGELGATRRDLVSWVGHEFTVRAPDQRIDGQRYVFERWSDGRPRVHDIVSPADPTTYVAIFRRP